jgi:hypothetical protein
MSTIDDRIDRLTQTLERMLDQGRFSGGTSTGGNTTGGPTGNQYAAASAGITGFVNSAGRFAQGGATFTTVIEDVTKVMGAFGPVGQMLGSITGAVATNLVQMNQNLMASSKFGMGFSQNLGAFTEELAKAGIGQKQWVDMLQNNSKYIGGSALNAKASADAFLVASQALMTEGTVVNARLAGIDLSEFQDELLVSTNMLKFNSISSTATQELLKRSVVETVIEIDNMSRITGKSRQEIQKGVDATMKSNTMQLAMLAMGGEELARYKKSAVTFNQFGTDIGNVFAEVSANKGNVVSKAGTETMAAINMIAPEAAKALIAASKEGNAERRAQLELEFRYRMAEATNDQNKMQSMVALAEKGDPGVKQAVSAIVQSNQILAADKARIEYGGGTREGFLASAAADRAQKNKELDPLNNPTAGNQVSVGLNAAEAATKTISAAVAGQAKTMLEGAGQKMVDANLKDTYVKAFSVKEVSSENVKNLINGAVGNTAVSTKPGTNPLSSTLSEKLKINSSSTEPLHVTGTVRIDPTAPPQAAGSKDTFGSWFGKDWGAGGLSILHGKEAVVPEGKMVEFINDMVAQAPGMLSGLQGSLRNSVAENNPTAALERAMQQFSSSVNIPSTLSPANSSTAINGSIMETKTTSDLLTSIEKLNTKMDKLITAVEDSGNANVKAVKSRGNLIA